MYVCMFVRERKPISRLPGTLKFGILIDSVPKQTSVFCAPNRRVSRQGGHYDRHYIVFENVYVFVPRYICFVCVPEYDIQYSRPSLKQALKI